MHIGNDGVTAPEHSGWTERFESAAQVRQTQLGFVKMGADAAVKPFAEVIHGLDGVVDALQGRKALQVEISQFERVTACSNCVFDGGGQLGAGVLEGDGKIVDRDCRGELRSCGGRGRAQVGNKSAMVKSVSCPTPVITGTRELWIA